MTKSTKSHETRESPVSIKNHAARNIATDGADGYVWDPSLGGFKGLIPTPLLTTTGRKSGRLLTLPLIFGRSGVDHELVVSKGVAPTQPARHLNLQAIPEVAVQVTGEKFTARVRTTGTPAGALQWPMMADIYEPYVQYQTKAGRQMPIVVLTKV